MNSVCVIAEILNAGDFDYNSFEIKPWSHYKNIETGEDVVVSYESHEEFQDTVHFIKNGNPFQHFKMNRNTFARKHQYDRPVENLYTMDVDKDTLKKFAEHIKGE